MDADMFPSLAHNVGKDLIVTDGTTLPPIEIPEKHILGNWVVYGPSADNCENNIYYAVCENCNHIEKIFKMTGLYEIMPKIS